MHFAWEKPTLENSPSLAVTGIIERYGGKFQHPSFHLPF
jgi:hypothetical protein